MAADGSVVFTTELDPSGLKSGLSKIGSTSAKWAGTAVKGVGAALAGITTGLAALAKAGVTYNAQMENYTTNFGVMLGDEARAVEHVAELREMAAKTPFGMKELANASQTMLSFGLTAEDSAVAMQQLGDISLGNKERFNSLALAFSQVSAAGKLSGQDLLQMVNAGFNPLNTIAEKTGVSLGDLKDVMAGGRGSKEFRKQMKAAQKEVKKMGDQASEGAKMLAQIGEDGAISAEMIGWAMSIETSPGGRFYEGMLKASQTFSGVMSTLSDDAMELVGKVFEPLTENMAKNLLPIAQGWIAKLSDAFEKSGTEGLVDSLGEVIGDAITKAAEGLPSVLTLASNLLNKIGVSLTENSSKISEGLSGAVAAIAESNLPETAVSSLLTIGASIVASITKGISDNAGGIIEGISTGLTTFMESGQLGDLASSLFDVASSIINGISDSLPELLPALAKDLVKGIGTAISGLPELATAAGNLITGLKEGLFGTGEEGSNGAVGEIAKGIIEGINGFFKDNFPELKFNLPEWNDIVDWATKLKNELTEFFQITIGLKPPEEKDPIKELNEKMLNSGYGLSQGENPEGNIPDLGIGFWDALVEKYYEGAQERQKRLYELLGISSAGAAELPPEATSANNQTAAALVEDFNASLREQAQSGALSYEELVALMIPTSGEGDFESPQPSDTETGESNPLSQKIITEILSGLQQGHSTIVSGLNEILKSAQNSADTSGFSAVGAQIAGGVAQGIRNGTSVVVAAVNRMIQAALDAAETAADINSPSRLFRDRVGMSIPEGTAVGVQNNAYLVRKAVNAMVMDGVPDMRRVNARVASVLAPVNARSTMESLRNAGVFNQTNNFNVPYATPDEVAKTMRMYATYGLAAEG